MAIRRRPSETVRAMEVIQGGPPDGHLSAEEHLLAAVLEQLVQMNELLRQVVMTMPITTTTPDPPRDGLGFSAW